MNNQIMIGAVLLTLMVGAYVTMNHEIVECSFAINPNQVVGVGDKLDATLWCKNNFGISLPYKHGPFDAFELVQIVTDLGPLYNKGE